MKKTGGPKTKKQGPEIQPLDPVAKAAARLEAQMPRLVELALRNAGRGKPTVLRTVRGILRDLQREARERTARGFLKRPFQEFEELGPVSTLEARMAAKLIAHMRASNFSAFYEHLAAGKPADTAPQLDLDHRIPDPALAAALGLRDSPKDTTEAPVSKKPLDTAPAKE